MPHVVTRACCNDASCVAVCPVNCIHPTPDEPDYGTTEMLYIDPAVCVDCAACVEVCPVGAISADYDLGDDQAGFEDINAHWYDGIGRRDYPQEQQEVRVREWAGGDLRVAVVGAGPAAFYAAEELLSQRGLEVRVDMFERLPTPGGLVRFGVAPDHQDTKEAAKTFANTMRRKGLRLFLNTEVGTDLTLDALRARYHAVLVAVGALADRPLGIPGEDLPGSHSATEFVGWYNGHPDFSQRTFDLSAERAVVVGNGNVALDVARILALGPDRLAKTDISDQALEQLRASTIREIVVIGRRGPTEASFTTKELLALARTPGVDVVVRPEELQAGRTGPAAPVRKVEVLTELLGHRPGADRRITLRFLAAPTEIIGDGWVEGVRLCRTRLLTDEDGVVRAVPTGDFEELACRLVFRSVGYRGSPVPGLPFDDERGIVPNDDGRVIDPGTGDPVQGVYAAGWIKRGPSGSIGTNRKCAKDTVEHLLNDYRAGRLPVPSEPGDIADELPQHIGLGGWRLINDHELDAGRRQHRPRVKLVDLAELLAVARRDG